MIRLEKFDNRFYTDLISWIETEETLMQFAGPEFSFPLTIEQLDKSLSDRNRIAFRVLNEETNLSIGHAEIYLTDRSAYFGRILIGDEKQRGKGFGQQIIKLLLAYTFSNLKKTKVELNVFDWNICAIKCYEKVGFSVNPDKKSERKIKGKIWTAINMAIHKEKWEYLQSSKKGN